MLHVVRSRARAVPSADRLPDFGLPVPPEEWLVATTARPNLLLEGPAHITSAIVRALAPHLKTPIALFDAQPRFDRPATLILDDATRLTVLAQQRLLEWLDDRGERMQVIATAPRPLFAAVERGAFLPALYYRLNVLRLRCGPTP